MNLKHFFILWAITFGVQKAFTQPVELRGVWLTNVDSDVLDSRDQIAEAMQFLADHHFNVVFPVVWNDASTMYPSAVMEQMFDLPIDDDYEDRDPLAEVIEEAHNRNIAVIAWFEYGFSASHKKDGGMILDEKPHWAARDNNGKLLTKNGFEWMNGYHPEVQQFLIDLITEVVKKYQIDGVQGDDRLPAQPIEGGYSAFTKALYRAEHSGVFPPDDFRNPAWQRWRADKLNAFARNMYQRVKALNPEVLICWAPSVYPWSYDEYLQDWPAWLREGYADLVIPQCYRYRQREYQEAIDELNPNDLQIRQTFMRLIYPGVLMNVGDYRIGWSFLENCLRYNRANHFSGEVFFFYEGLRKNNNELARKLLETVYREKALIPWKKMR